jgi:hypothetical protein
MPTDRRSEAPGRRIRRPRIPRSAVELGTTAAAWSSTPTNSRLTAAAAGSGAAAAAGTTLQPLLAGETLTVSPRLAGVLSGYSSSL